MQGKTGDCALQCTFPKRGADFFFNQAQVVSVRRRQRMESKHLSALPTGALNSTATIDRSSAIGGNR